MPSAELVPERLARLLALVAYLHRERSVPVTELAELFGVAPDQVMADVWLLWVTGTPGYMPDDLLDFVGDDLDDGVVTLIEDRRLGAPLRLAGTEAVALIAALRALTAQPGIAGAEAASSALAKLLRAVAGAEGATVVQAELAASPAPPQAAVIAQAIGQGQAIRIDYVNAADHRSSRLVDPVRIATDREHWLLAAWDRSVGSAGEARLFRLDRILAVEVTDLGVGRHEIAVPASGFSGDGGAVPVSLVLARGARWLAEQLDPLEDPEDRPDGALGLRVAVASMAWLRSLALGLAEDVMVTHPPEVRQALAAEARAGLDAYLA
jgi:proteasome accessory factor C